MIKSKKYLIFGLGAMFVLNVLDIFTTFWNDPTLKSEVNPLFLKYSLGPFGLIVVLLVYQIIYSIFFTYHAYYFNGYNYKSENKNYLDFTRRFLGFSNRRFAFSMNNSDAYLIY